MENIISNKNYYIKEIQPKIAREMIIKYHYSHKVVPNSKVHLGIFKLDGDELVGVLQYGYPMNPKQTPSKLVENSTKDEMYELNRMAMLDDEPKCCESQAIGLSIKWIKRNKPHIKWLLSFSDGKEGNVGIIYQATNWLYCGYKISDSFYDLDGVTIHAIQIWHKHKNKPSVENMDTVYKDFNNVSRFHARQYIYIMPIDKKVNILRPIEEFYPKRETEPKITKQIIYKENGVILDKKRVVDFLINV